MRVLLPTDGSKHAEQAARLLARLPHAELLELTVLAVTPMIEFHGSVEVVEWMKRSKEAEKTKAVEVCQRIERIFEGANARVKTLVVEGSPGSTIVAQADSMQAELVVLGAVGMRSLERMMLGSVSDFVATHAPCSVLVVRPQELAAPHGALKLCLADDESPQAQFAIKDLSKFGWGGHTHIDLVNIVLFPVAYSDVPIPFDTEPIHTAMREKLDKRKGELLALSPHVQTHVIESSHVGASLVEFTKEHDSDLLVVGSTGRGLLARFLLGSSSRFALHHAKCSIWISRAPSRDEPSSR